MNTTLAKYDLPEATTAAGVIAPYPSASQHSRHEIDCVTLSIEEGDLHWALYQRASELLNGVCFVTRFSDVGSLAALWSESDSIFTASCKTSPETLITVASALIDGSGVKSGNLRAEGSTAPEEKNQPDRQEEEAGSKRGLSGDAGGAMRLLESWLADESGYDDKVWPQIKEELDKDRLSSRPLFDD